MMQKQGKIWPLTALAILILLSMLKDFLIGCVFLKGPLKFVSESNGKNIDEGKNGPGKYQLNIRNLGDFLNISKSQLQSGAHLNSSQKHNLKITSHSHQSYQSTGFFFASTKPFDCKKMIEGDLPEQTRVVESNIQSESISVSELREMASNCNKFVKKRHYTTHPLSKEEEEFSLAYSIIMYKDVQQVERLLRAIYHPQNFYCIHVDASANNETLETMCAVAACLKNVFIASRLVNVNWGKFSLIEAELICMEDLWKHTKWKYFINLTGQGFPLKTNFELVNILKIFNGANSVDGSIKRRFGSHERRTSHLKPLPFNVTITTGSTHIVVQRGFVDFVLHNPRALMFRNWLKPSGVPDETFFTSLNYNPQLGVPGSYIGEPETDSASVINNTYPRNPFLARFKNWNLRTALHQPKFNNWPCHGKRVRKICIFGIGDLPLLSKRPELFANKFHMDFQPQAYDCLEELIFNRTRLHHEPGYTFNDTYYKNIGFVHSHV